MRQEHLRCFSPLQLIILVALCFFVAATYTHAYGGECGTMHALEFIKNQKQLKDKGQASVKHEPQYEESKEKCKVEYEYGTRTRSKIGRTLQSVL